MKTTVLKRIVALLLVTIMVVSQAAPVEAAKKNLSTEQTRTVKEEEPYTKEDLRLLSALIFCEAGSECYAGKVAVGIVVMNRVRSKLFKNTLEGVVYQKRQFTPASSGALKAQLRRYDQGKFTTQNEKDCIKAAKEALSGTTVVTYNNKKIEMKSYLYFSGSLKGARLTIQHHKFK